MADTDDNKMTLRQYKKVKGPRRLTDNQTSTSELTLTFDGQVTLAWLYANRKIINLSELSREAGIKPSTLLSKVSRYDAYMQSKKPGRLAYRGRLPLLTKKERALITLTLDRKGIIPMAESSEAKVRPKE